MKKLVYESKFLFPTLFLILFSGCQMKRTAQKYQERYRPQYHFTPESHWMNDPNGMFFYEGEYHLFYQHYPKDIVWGPMHWGHAVSKDLLHWEQLPIALYPDSLGYIFSGSAVVDWKNTSGLGTSENPPIVALYTYHDPIGEQAQKNDFQTQGLAYSLDRGRSWKNTKTILYFKTLGFVTLETLKSFGTKPQNIGLCLWRFKIILLFTDLQTSSNGRP